MIEINKIYNEDCMETMKRMPDNFVDLVVTSPPYNFDAGSGLGNKYNGQKDGKSMNEYYEWSVKIITELLRVSKLVCYNIQMLAGNKEALMQLIGKFAFQIRDIIIWDKMNEAPAMNEKVLNSRFEFIFILSANGGGRKIEEAQFDRGTVSNLWKISHGKQLFKEHSATFTELLSDKLVKCFSKENDLVYDCFMGSGTTAISSLRYKRNFIGSEISPKYCKLANKRIENFTNQIKIEF